MNYGEICIYTIPAVIILSYVIEGIMSSLGGSIIRTMFFYVFCISFIFHELAHWMMCKVFGVEVSKVVLFKVEKEPESHAMGFQGYVLPKSPANSVLANLFISLGPLVINGLLVALIWYYYPAISESPWYPFCIYLGIGLAIGSMPSSQDMKTFFSCLRRSPGRGLLELVLLIIFLWVAYSSFVIWALDIWLIITIIGGFVLFSILYARQLNRPQRRTVLPRI
jgi:hypothetical protein